MTRIFKKEDTIKSFKVEDNKVFTTITLGEYNITNPTLEQFLSTGWEEYTPEPTPEPEPHIPTLEEIVQEYIRSRYSINQEFEVQRKRDTEPEAFTEYYNYVEECISWAKQQPHREIE